MSESDKPLWIRLDDICEMIGVSPRTLKRYVANGDFPAPIKLTPRTNVWFKHEVVAWMNEMAGARRAA